MHDPTMSRYKYLSFIKQDNYRRYIHQPDQRILQNVQLKPVETNTQAHGTYGALLFDPRWKARRIQILNRDAQRCLICKSEQELQVHHRQYHFSVRENKFRLPWEYADHLLITLCEACHKRGHNQYKVPIINI